MTIAVERPRNRATILVVEDDPDVRDLVRELLERAGYRVEVAEDGRGALGVLFSARPDLVVLDVVMPRLDGWETLERIRDATGVPVLMLTALATEVEKVRALTAGADDYVTKPFGRHELVARVEALLRRAPGARDRDPSFYDDGVIVIDHSAREVRVGGRGVQLTPLEYRLLQAFVTRPDEVVTHEELLEAAWGTARGGSRDRVRLYVNYLRAKLGAAAGGRIETVRGFGYRYRPPSA